MLEQFGKINIPHMEAFTGWQHSPQINNWQQQKLYGNSNVLKIAGIKLTFAGCSQE
jgi:hypothetical protein